MPTSAATQKSIKRLQPSAKQQRGLQTAAVFSDPQLLLWRAQPDPDNIRLALVDEANVFGKLTFRERTKRRRTGADHRKARELLLQVVRDADAGDPGTDDEDVDVTGVLDLLGALGRSGRGCSRRHSWTSRTHALIPVILAPTFSQAESPAGRPGSVWTRLAAAATPPRPGAHGSWPRPR